VASNNRQEPKPPEQKSEFSDSTRNLLDALAKEREHENWLKSRRKERMEYARGWITWITAAWVLKGLLWESLATFVKDHFR
jgi:hypothetical protein